MVKIDKGLYVEIGKQLKAARISKGMSLQDVSNAINGIKTKQTIMRYENGTSRPEAEVMKSICSVLGIDVTQTVKNAKMRSAYDDKCGASISEAYNRADEKTQRMVRILLGLE